MYFISIPSFIVMTWAVLEILNLPNFITADPVTWINVKGHKQWYRCPSLNGGDNHTNFDLARYNSLWEIKPNVMFVNTAGWPNTDHHTDSHFSCKSITSWLLYPYNACPEFCINLKQTYSVPLFWIKDIYFPPVSLMRILQIFVMKWNSLYMKSTHSIYDSKSE